MQNNFCGSFDCISLLSLSPPRYFALSSRWLSSHERTLLSTTRTSLQNLRRGRALQFINRHRHQKLREESRPPATRTSHVLLLPLKKVQQMQNAKITRIFFRRVNRNRTIFEPFLHFRDITTTKWSCTPSLNIAGFLPHVQTTLIYANYPSSIRSQHICQRP